MNAVDTNVFVYMFDDDAAAKQAKARQLIGQLVQPPLMTILPWQVAGELLSCLRKWEAAGRITVTDVQTHFQDVLSMFPLRMPTAKVFEVSFELRARFSLSHWDSMLLAACKDAAATTLFSEDMDSRTDYDGLKIVNPFA
jgi:predicted nucleic acid-binding protein